MMTIREAMKPSSLWERPGVRALVIGTAIAVSLLVIALVLGELAKNGLLGQSLNDFVNQQALPFINANSPTSIGTLVSIGVAVELLPVALAYAAVKRCRPEYQITEVKQDPVGNGMGDNEIV